MVYWSLLYLANIWVRPILLGVIRVLNLIQSWFWGSSFFNATNWGEYMMRNTSMKFDPCLIWRIILIKREVFNWSLIQSKFLIKFLNTNIIIKGFFEEIFPLCEIECNDCYYAEAHVLGRPMSSGAFGCFL